MTKNSLHKTSIMNYANSLRASKRRTWKITTTRRPILRKAYTFLINYDQHSNYAKTVLSVQIDIQDDGWPILTHRKQSKV
jgi:hypothetical protein